ncbi:hypothetical protein [Curtobacterium sp. L1-20]|uniref:hypothetical protein n=1 Tax=Curtobacterium sp. L1-20 TaxID=3138181 RepID=UPI003B51566E
MTQRTSHPVRLLAATAVAASVALLGTGCAFVQQQTGDAWAVTYEVTVDRPAGSPLSDVTVEGAERRGDAPEVQRLGTRDTRATHGQGSRWEHESVVLAGQRASVSATPAPGATATCRVLLDGDREIATRTSPDPGAAVTCSVETPAFSRGR